MNRDEAVVVRTYSNEAIASIAASSLGSAGIEAQIQKDDCGGAYPALQMARGVRLLVKPEDVEEAEKILLDMEMQDTGEAEEPEEPEDREKTKSNPILLIGLLLVGLVAGYFLSPSLVDRSTYTGVVKEDFNAAGKPGVFFHYVEGKLSRAEEDRNYDGKPDAGTSLEEVEFVPPSMMTTLMASWTNGRRTKIDSTISRRWTPITTENRMQQSITSTV